MRHHFAITRQTPDQSFDSFVTDLKLKAKDCEYGTITDSLICTQIVTGLRNNALRTKLLAIASLDLAQAVTLCRAEESSVLHASTIAPHARSSEPPILTSPLLDAISTPSRGRARFRHSYRGRSDSALLSHGSHGVPRPPGTSRSHLNPFPTSPRLPSQRSTFPTDSESRNPCYHCGLRHPNRRCPAQGTVCAKCGKPNHWANVCRSAAVYSLEASNPSHPADANHTYPDDEYYSNFDYQALEDDLNNFSIASLTLHSTSTAAPDWHATVFLTNLPIRFKLDTGSQVNVITETLYNQLTVRPPLIATTTHVTSYSGHKIPMIGFIHTPCSSTVATATVTFYVTNGDTTPILGACTTEALGLIARLCQTTASAPTTAFPDSPLSAPHTVPTAVHDITPQQLVQRYSDVFDEVGCLPGEHSITLRQGTLPVVIPPRVVPHALRVPLRQELDRMTQLKIITPVTEPTDWVHPIVLVPKPDGTLRLCLDPRNLNSALKREHYKLPTTQEIFGDLQGSRVFTVLDAVSAFWQIRLTEESSKLCTFATPFGRFRFLRLPYGIASASEIFQRTMQNLLAGIPHTYVATDDVLIAATDIPHHNDILHQVLERARSSGLKFSTKKLKLAASTTNYLGHTLTAGGIRVDNSKITAIQAMTPPQSRTDLQRFLGMVNYLSKFVCHHSDKAAPLRQLLRKTTEFFWDLNHQRVFDQLKADIVNAPMLAFFDPSLPITLSVDASQHGIGAVLLQAGKPVEYASTSLTETQTRYAQIEKELLAIMYALERFHFYVTGTKPTVQTDHKPLLAIVKKPLHMLSPRLGRMVLRISRYDPLLVHVPGTDLHIADALSRAPLDSRTIDTTEFDSPQAALHSLTALSTSAATSFKDATANDPELQAVKRYLARGWPQHFSQLKGRPGHRFWDLKEELHEDENLLYRGDRLVIPSSEKERVLSQLHNAHQGVNACLRKAKLHTYWPGMVSDIEIYIQKCHICRTRDRANTHAPLHPHPVPELPWNTVGIDLYHGKRPTLLIVDYHSKFVEVDELSTSTASAVIKAIEPHFSRYGAPSKVVSDNGPPFNSSEMATFFRDWGVTHVTSSPHYPRSNGMVERHIQTIKNLMAKALLSGVNPHLVLLEYRSTPTQNLPAPSQSMMGRLLRTPNTTNIRTLQPLFPTHENIQRLIELQNRMKDTEDKLATMSSISQFQVGAPVRHLVSHRNWQPATIIGHANEPDSYHIKTMTGQTYRRNRHHLRPACFPELNVYKRPPSRIPTSPITSDDNPSCTLHVSIPSSKGAPVIPLQQTDPASKQTVPTAATPFDCSLGVPAAANATTPPNPFPSNPASYAHIKLPNTGLPTPFVTRAGRTCKPRLISDM